MTTITTMTAEGADTSAGATDNPGAQPLPQPGRTPHQTRSALVVPLPTAIVAALITAMFGLLFFSLNGLSSDIDSLRAEISSLRSDTTSQIDSLRADTTSQIDSLRADTTSQIDSLRGDIETFRSEMTTILLDHAERLARIETHLNIGPEEDGSTSSAAQSEISGGLGS